MCLSTEYGIGSNLLQAAMRDRASVNSVAMRTLSIVFPNILDIGCFSHTLDHVGEHFNTPALDVFMKVWISMFSSSPKTKLAWTTKTGLSIPSYSVTRWWSKWEVMKFLHDSFGDVESFLEIEDLPPSKVKLQEILHDPPSKRKLMIELAMTIDAGEPFVKATYCLEGDGPLIFSAYEEIKALERGIEVQYYPNTNAVANSLTTDPSRRKQLVDYGKACVKPADEYFRQKFQNDLKLQLSVFQYTRYFDPSKVCDLNLTATDVDNLKVIPYFTSSSV